MRSPKSKVRFVECERQPAELLVPQGVATATAKTLNYYFQGWLGDKGFHAT
jgi:hypothetical protein